MAELAVPDYVSDPPVDWPHYEREAVARRWLNDLGLDTGGSWQPASGPPDLIGLLAARLGTSARHIGSILQEAARQHWLKRVLREVFDPVPHEIGARQQFVRLLRTTDGLPSRSGHKVWVHPQHVDLDSLRREFADYPELIEGWNDWTATWAALVARNPRLELRRRMGEVFDNHLFNSWEIGQERLLYDWLARGSRDPMPFLDHRGILTEDYYRRLCELRALAGGWFYWRNDIGQIVFVPLVEWEAIRATWPSLLEQACADVRDHAGP